MVDVSKVALTAQQAVESSFTRLGHYLSFAPISSEAEATPRILSLAQTLRTDLAAAGLERARVLELPDAHPCVAAEWMKKGPGAPTILIYGHYDVQPVKGETWTTEPHTLVRKGDRLYG